MGATSHSGFVGPLILGVVVLLAVYLAQIELHEEFSYEMKNWTDKYGYPLESHEYTSEDGFITVIHRIPHGRHPESPAKVRPAVIIQCGIFCASDQLVMIGPEYDLVYILADNGFDVWINNIRGNHYSKRHINGTLSDYEMQPYNSMDELGRYDLPAAVDYILNITGHEKLSYIGFSLGCPTFAVFESMRPEYASKIDKAMLMAPFLHIVHTHPTYITLFHILTFHFQTVMDFIGGNSRNHLKNLFYHFFVLEWNPITQIFWFFLSDVEGYEADRNYTLSRLYFSRNPSGSFVGQWKQLLDNYLLGEFRRPYVDWRENIARYGDVTPPSYNVSRVTTPLHLYYAETDRLIRPEDVKFAMDSLPNVASVYKVDEKGFSHFNFLMYHKKPNKLFNDIIKKLKTR